MVGPRLFYSPLISYTSMNALYLHRVISRDGYVVVDDTNRPALDGDKDWPWVLNSSSTPPDPDTCYDILPEMVQELITKNIVHHVSYTINFPPFNLETRMWLHQYNRV